MQNTYPLLLSAVFCIALTPVVRAFADSRGIVDIPRERRIHTRPVPLLGGVAIFASFITAVLLTAKLSGHSVGLMVGGAVIVVVGVIDDITELRPVVKLAGQVMAAWVLVSFGVKIEFVTNPFGGMLYLGRLAMPITIVWIVALTNVVNFIDGLDGLAAGVSAIAGLAMGYVALTKGQSQVGLLAFALAGSAFGFLRYNFNPARIFMGDAGAMFLGFSLAGISAMGALKGPATIALTVPVVILGVPIFDTAFAIVRRMRKGIPVSAGDREHLHHRLIAMGLSQRQAVAAIYLASSVLAATAYLMAAVGAETSYAAVGLVFVAMAGLGARTGLLRQGGGNMRS